MPADQPPQNIYDDPAFFAGYAQFPRFGTGWSGAYEYSAFMSLFPDPTGLRALDLGCGAGRLAHYLAEHGAAEVVGVDLSERMLAIARAECGHPRVSFQRTSIEDASFQPGSVDLVVSSLALHYVADYAGLARRIAEWLAPGGLLVYSVEHPVYLSRATSEGWVLDAEGQRTGWSVDRYAEEGLRVESWIVEGVRKYHRTISTLLNGLIDAGLAIERVLEPTADVRQLEQHPEWADENRRPFCLLVRARKA